MSQIDEKFAIEFMISLNAKPISPFPGGAKPWPAICLTCNESISPRYANVKNGHAPCKYCSGKALKPNEPQEICREKFLEPLENYPGNLKSPWKCRCLKCGAVVHPRLGDLKRGQGGCLPCSYQIRTLNQRLDQEEAFQSMFDAGAYPLEEYSGSVDTPWLCKCLTCGETVTPKLHSIRSGQGPCTSCGRKITGTKVRHSIDDAVSTMNAAGFKPLVAYPGAGFRWKCACLNCGHESSPTLANVQNGTRCIYCARANIERTSGSILYLIQHSTWIAYKIGVGNRSRLEAHRKHGWEIVKTWQMDSVQDAYRSERQILVYIRDVFGLPQYLDKSLMPQGGFTETFSGEEISTIKILDLVETVKSGLNTRDA
jgi:formylmethanofuran dehydrogenase subunit E